MNRLVLFGILCGFTSAHAADPTIFRIVAQKVLKDQTRIRMVMSFDTITRKWLELGFAEVGDHYEKILEPKIELSQWEKDSALVFVGFPGGKKLRMIATIKPQSSTGRKTYDSFFVEEANKGITYYGDPQNPNDPDYAFSTWMTLDELKQNQWTGSRYLADPLDFELFTQSWSTLIAQTQPDQNQLEPAPSSPVVVGETIRRWRAEFPKPTGLWMDSVLVLATIYNPDGDDAALIEFAMRQNNLQSTRGSFNAQITMDDVDEFAVTQVVNPKTKKIERAFRIRLKSLKDYYKRLSNGAKFRDLFAPSIFYVFRDGTFMADHNAWKDWLINENAVDHVQAIVDESPSGYFKFLTNIPNPRLVHEQYTVSPVPYDDYFEPRGVKLHQAKHNEIWFTSRWQDSTPYGEAPPPRLESRELALTGRMRARGEEVLAFLTQVEKPTIAQYLKFIGGPPEPDEDNPFAMYYAFGQTMRAALKRDLPKLINNLETAFPGATWYGLGRDIFLLNDSLDAFYTYVGEPGRVVRVPASAASFQNSQREIILDFLRPLGFETETLKQGPPKIFFDITSYGARGRTSQSNHLMRSLYGAWADAGHDPQELVRQINFVSTGYTGDTLYAAALPADINAYFASVKIKESGPERILRFDIARDLQYTDAWHGIYQSFERDTKGAVVSRPGLPSGRDTKLKLLAELWDICQTVMNKNFVRSVNRRILDTSSGQKKYCVRALEAPTRTTTTTTTDVSEAP